MEQGANAGLSWETIAESAYLSYAASTGNKNFQGNPMPLWKELPEPIRIAWEAAARHVEHCLRTPQMHDDEYRMQAEIEWAGWKPPV